MVFNPDEWLLENEPSSIATMEEPEPTFDPDAYLSDFDPDVYLGIEPEEKPGLWEKVKGVTGKVIQKGKEFWEAGFGGPVDVPAPATAYEETFAPDVDFSPDEYLKQMEGVEPLEFPAGFEGMTKEEQEEVLAHKPTDPFPEITVEDKKAIVDNLIDQGKESMAGDFIQKVSSAGAGAISMVPGLKTALGRDINLSPQTQKLIEEEPAAYATGAITSAAAQILSTVGGVQSLLKGTRIANSKTLMNVFTRGISAGVHRGALESEKVAWDQTSVGDALFNTLVESAGGAAFSVVPEVVLPSKAAAQIIGQVLSGLMYQGAVDKAANRKFYNADGEEVGLLSKEWFMTQLPTIAADLGFAVRDVASGSTFKAEVATQRAEIKGWLKGKGSKGFKVEEVKYKVGGKEKTAEVLGPAEEAKTRIDEAVDRLLGEAGIGKEAKAEAPIKEAEVKPGETRIKGGKQFEGYKPTAEEAAKLPEPTPEEVKAAEEIAKLPEAPKGPEAEPKHTYEDLQKAGLTDEQIENLYPGMTKGKKPKPKKPTPKKTDIEEIAKGEKELEKEYEQFEIQSARKRQIIDTEREEIEYAQRIRQRLTTEKTTRVIKKGDRAGKDYETTIQKTDLTEEDLKAITGESTAGRSPEINAKLEKMAENFNIAKKHGKGATVEDVPPARILAEIDNWSADDVANLLSKGFATKKAYTEWQKGLKARESELLEQEEIFTEDIAKRGEALGGRAKDEVFSFDDPELFKTPKVEAPFETEAGAVRTDIIPTGRGTRRSSAFAKMLKRNFTTRGHLPEKVFTEKVARDGWVNSELKETEYTLNEFRKAAKKAYKTKKLTDKQAFEIDAAFKGEKPISELPKEIQPLVTRMRNHVDALSQRLIDAGVVEGDLAARITENMGFYATRTYRVFDDPKWAKKVPEDVRNNAKSFVRGELDKPGTLYEGLVVRALDRNNFGRILKIDEESGMATVYFRNKATGAEATKDLPLKELTSNRYTKKGITEDEVRGIIDELLYKEKAPVNLMSTGSRLGQKALGILRARKDIPAPIRALWGEYKNADVNYAKSVSKMSHLIANHEFLTEVAALGEGKFFFDSPVVKEGESYSAKISVENNPTMKPLDGLYTTKEIKTAFEDAVEREAVPDWLRLYMKVNSVVKYSKTIGSAMTHLRNVTGNVSFAVANGHFNALKMGNAIKTTFADVRGKPRGEMRKYIKELVRLGVVGESARAGEIKAIIDDATQGNMDALIGYTGKKRVREGLQVIEKLYGAEDDVWKIFAFESELKRYRKALPDLPEKYLKQKVATIVRDTYPTYSMIPRGIRKLRRFPLVGTFVSFPAEVMRTAKNTIKLMATEMKDPKLKGIGMQRLTGIIMAATVTTGLSIASRFNSNVSKKKEEAAREFMPPWSENSQLIFLNSLEGGEGNYIDLGYSDPHSYLKSPVIAFMRGEDWESKILETGAELFAPFLSEDIMTQKLLDVRRNKTKAGQPVYNPEDTDAQKAKDVIAHVVEAIEPGTLSGIRRVYKATQKEEGKAGTSYGVGAEVTAQTTGVRVSKLDVKRSLGFKVYEFNRDIRNAARLSRKRGVTTSYESKKKIYDRFSKTYQAAKLLGLTDVEIMNTLNEAGMSWETIAYFKSGTYDIILKGKEKEEKIIKGRD